MTGDDGELLPAASFIEAAERSGMIQELDRWVVARALELLGRREREGDPVSLHVNLSGASLADISVLEFIERRLDEGDADPARCTFEITATAKVARLRRPAASPTASPSSAVRSRSTTTAPASGPSTTSKNSPST